MTRILRVAWSRCCLMLVMPLLWSGCAYTTQHAIPPHLKTVYVAPFRNEINIAQEPTALNRYPAYFPLLETQVTNAIIGEFLVEGSLRLVSDPDRADVLVEGELLRYERDPLRFSRTQEVEEYRLRVMVDARIRDNWENTMLWKGRVSGESTYFTKGRFSISEDTAVADTVDDLARRVVEHAVEQW